MPYIKQEDRGRIHIWNNPRNAGELNYSLTRQCIKYLEFFGEKYAVFNDIIGALECAKLELYRRKVSVLEDQKIQENGDVY